MTKTLNSMSKDDLHAIAELFQVSPELRSTCNVQTL